MFCRSIGVAALMAVSSSHAVKPAPIYMYRIGDVSTPIIFTNAINDHGQIVGQANFAGALQAFVTGPNGQGMINLGALLGSAVSEATGVNNSGAVVGTFAAVTTDRARSFVYSDGAGARPLFEGRVGDRDVPVDINDNSQIVGYTGFTGATNGFVVNFDGSGYRVLPSLGGRFSSPRAINNAGLIVGSSSTPDGATNATSYYLGEDRLVDMGRFGGTSAVATAVSERGFIAGTVQFNGSAGSFSTSRSVPGGQVRPSLGGDYLYLRGITPAGSVVGAGTKTSNPKSNVAVVGNAKGLLFDANLAVVNAPKDVILVDIIAVNAKLQAVALGSDGESYIVCHVKRCGENTPE